jgi:hypothetical protein
LDESRPRMEGYGVVGPLSASARSISTGSGPIALVSLSMHSRRLSNSYQCSDVQGAWKVEARFPRQLSTKEMPISSAVQIRCILHQKLDRLQPKSNSFQPITETIPTVDSGSGRLCPLELWAAKANVGNREDMLFLPWFGSSSASNCWNDRKLNQRRPSFPVVLPRIPPGRFFLL